MPTAKSRTQEFAMKNNLHPADVDALTHHIQECIQKLGIDTFKLLSQEEQTKFLKMTTVVYANNMVNQCNTLMANKGGTLDNLKQQLNQTIKGITS
jgi:hypothetical protein